MFCTICGEPEDSWLCYGCRVIFLKYEDQFAGAEYTTVMRTSYYLDIRETSHGISLGSEDS